MFSYCSVDIYQAEPTPETSQTGPCALKSARFTYKARYPPPEIAIPIFGRDVTLSLSLSIYAPASNPVMFIRIRNSRIGSTVAFLLCSNHVTSLGERAFADLIVGRFAGQVTSSGAYPPEGEFGSALFTADIGATAATIPSVCDFTGRGPQTYLEHHRRTPMRRQKPRQAARTSFWIIEQGRARTRASNTTTGKDKGMEKGGGREKRGEGRWKREEKVLCRSSNQPWFE